MEIDSGKSYDSSKWEMHLSHGALLCLSIVFSWVLWCIVDLPVFNKMNGWPLFWEILKNFGEQIIETTILLELSLVYIRFIVKIFWNKEKERFLKIHKLFKLLWIIKTSFPQVYKNEILFKFQ